MLLRFQAAWSGPGAARPIILPGEWRFPLTMSRRCKSKSSWLELVPGQERVNDNGHSDQRQRHKSEPDFRAGKILGRYHADLCADDCAGVHNECDQNIDIALDCVSECSVTG